MYFYVIMGAHKQNDLLLRILVVHCFNFFISYHFLCIIVTYIPPIPTERNALKKFFKTYYYTAILYTIGHTRGKTWKLSIWVIYVDSLDDMNAYLHNNLYIYTTDMYKNICNILNITSKQNIPEKINIYKRCHKVSLWNSFKNEYALTYANNINIK